MTDKSFIEELALRLHKTEAEISGLLEATVDALNEKLSENTQISIENFGVFKTRKNPEYISVNPETHERYLVPPAVEILFESAPELKEYLKNDIKESC